MKIADKILSKFQMDSKTKRETRDRIQRALCKLSKEMRNNYCDSLTGKDEKEKNKDKDKRDKEKEDQKKDDQKK